MKVKELIAKLQEFDEELDVMSRNSQNEFSSASLYKGSVVRDVDGGENSYAIKEGEMARFAIRNL